jgi:hypothetical protein
MKIKFNATKAEMRYITQIADRAAGECEVRDKLSLMMDLSATHSNGNPLDFKKLLAADTFTFSHDICKIMSHLDRETGKLTRCFMPRCSK